jgi:hypothetical protein
MSEMSDYERLTEATRTNQILVGSLITGVVAFLGIVVMLGALKIQQAAFRPGANGNAPAPAPFQPGIPILTYLAAGFAAVLLLLSFVLPSALTTRGRRALVAGTSDPNSPAGSVAPQGGPQSEQSEFGKLITLYSSQLIIGAAMLEGSAFFATVAYLVENNPIALGTALILLAALVARFPNAGWTERWITQQQERLRDERLAPASS